MTERLHVLLVEDDPDEADLIMKMLSRDKLVVFEVACAAHLSEALERVRADRFDIILLDIKLPDSDGRSAVRTMCQQAADIPILVLSGNDDERMGLDAIREGAQDYIIKGPADGNWLARSIKFVLARKRAEKTTPKSLSIRQFHESIMDAFARVDMSGRIIEFNGGFIELLGYTEEELRRLSYVDITPSRWRAIETRIIEQQVLTRGYSELYEKEYRRKDGTVVPVELRTSLLTDGTGRPSGMWAIIRDISERKTHEVEIERLNRLYSALSHVSQIIVRVHSREELFHEVCRVLVESGGFKMVWLGLHDPATHQVSVAAQHGDESGYLNDIRVFADDRPEGCGPTGTAIKEGKPYICNDFLNDPRTLPWRDAAARTSWRAAAGFPIRLAGEVCGALTVYALETNFFGDREVALLEEVAVSVSFGLDNLEREAQRRQAEDALLREQLFTKALLESLPGIFYLYTYPELRLVRWNKNHETLLGFGPGEIKDRSLFEWHIPEAKEAVQQAVEAAMEKGQNMIESPLLSKDGSSIPFLMTGAKFEAHGQSYLMGVGLDITERKRVEELLRESRERLDLALQSANMGVWRWEIIENRRIFDDRACHLLGIDPATFTGSLEEFFRVVHPEDRELIRAALTRTIEQKVPYESEYRVVWPDGSLRYITGRGRLVSDGQGRPVRFNGIVWDITRRKEAEEALRERNAWLDTIFQASPAAIYAMDTEGIILSWNKGAERIFGWSQDEAVGRLNPIVSEENRGAFRANREKILRGESFLGVELRRRKKDGTPIDISMSAAPLYDSAGLANGLMSVAIDITHQKKLETERAALENQLRQSQKLEAIGQLAGGVAHDFNNILSAIIGYSHLMLMKMDDDDPNRLNIQQILASSERATVLTQSLLAFSRKQAVNLTTFDLNDAVAKFEKFLLRLLREDIEFKTTLSKQELHVMADRSQIEQVLMNLVTNARDAMPRGGRIVVETSLVEFDHLFIETQGFGQTGCYVQLAVTDTGIGIPEGIKNKIFDPFFTTKEAGRGTGLGLSMVYGIVKQHQGHIDVHSQPGIGTTFRIYLPVARVLAQAAEHKPERQIPPRGGTETVLIAEDDASVRTLLASVLRQYGYTVIEAMDGQDAVAKFLENRTRTSLVVLDGIMPKKNGKEAWQEIKALSSKVKAIFVSGYAEDIFTKDGVPDKEAAFVQKPSPPLVFVRKVREVLDE